MGSKRTVAGAGAFLAMLILILDGKVAVQGAKDGIELCIQTVIPSLFPFFVLSNIITSVYVGSPIRWLRPIGKLCGIASGLESILIPVFLGGYPVAAQTIADGWRKGQIPKKDAQRMLGFCNNAGPSFLFGMAASLFPRPEVAWILWAIHIFTALMTAQVFPATCGDSGSLTKREISLTEVLRNAMRAMASVCGWILLFRVIIGFMKKWVLWLFPVSAQAAVVGMLELSNGCIGLFAVDDLPLRFVICSGILAFGGICVFMQIASAADGLSLKQFFLGKGIHTLLSILIASGIAYNKPVLLVAPVLLLLIKLRKKGSFPVKAGV